MKIAFDARAYDWTGIGRYIRNLLTQFRTLDTKHSFVVITGQGKAEKIQKELQLPVSRFSFREVSPRYYSWREQLVVPWQLAPVEADVWHFTHFNVPASFRRPYIVTIHDATRFIFPGQRRQQWLQQIAYEYVFTSALRHAQAAIFVSDNARQEVERLSLPVPANSVVIHEGIDEQFLQPVNEQMIQAVRTSLALAEPYLLYVGVWMSHKNLRRLLLAFASVAREIPQVKLVITGKQRRGYSPVQDWIKELGLEERVVCTGYVSRDLLPALYAASEGFIFPSLYEGFGLPPLEAAALGVPVVASSVSSIPEVMGGAAEYVNPEDEQDIARGMRRILVEGQRKEELRRLGQERATHFSWEVCARKTLDIYKYLY